MTQCSDGRMSFWKSKTSSLAGKETEAVVGGDSDVGGREGRIHVDTWTWAAGISSLHGRHGSTGSWKHRGLQEQQEAWMPVPGLRSARGMLVCRESLRNNRKNSTDQSDTNRRKSAHEVLMIPIRERPQLPLSLGNFQQKYIRVSQKLRGDTS